MPLSKVQSGMRDNITNSELPDIQASDLNITTQGVGLSGWEHIETRVAKSDGDTNFQNGTNSTNTSFACIGINLSTVKNRYQYYKMYFHLIHTGSTTANILFDTARMDQTSHSIGNWYGGALVQDTSNNNASLVRNASTTLKLINSSWSRGSATRNYGGGTQGEITAKGFHPEVTANMDGFDHSAFANDTTASEVTNTGYRTYYHWIVHTYNQASSVYQAVNGTARQNQTFNPTATGNSSNSFGGFQILINQAVSGSNFNFAKGSYISVYGLRMPSGD